MSVPEGMYGQSGQGMGDLVLFPFDHYPPGGIGTEADQAERIRQSAACRASQRAGGDKTPGNPHRGE
jgi:hypothetical protein